MPYNEAGDQVMVTWVGFLALGSHPRLISRNKRRCARDGSPKRLRQVLPGFKGSAWHPSRGQLESRDRSPNSRRTRNKLSKMTGPSAGSPQNRTKKPKTKRRFFRRSFASGCFRPGPPTPRIPSLQAGCLLAFGLQLRLPATVTAANDAGTELRERKRREECLSEVK